VLFFQKEGRQEAQDGVLSYVEKYTLRQTLFDQRARGNVEHEALNESSASYFAGSGVLVDQSLELLMQIAADFRDVFEQAFLLDDCQIFEADATGQRTSSKGGAVLAG